MRLSVRVGGQVGTWAQGAAFAPDGRTLFVGNMTDRDISVLKVGEDGKLSEGGPRIKVAAARRRCGWRTGALRHRAPGPHPGTAPRHGAQAQRGRMRAELIAADAAPGGADPGIPAEPRQGGCGAGWSPGRQRLAAMPQSWRFGWVPGWTTPPMPQIGSGSTPKACTKSVPGARGDAEVAAGAGIRLSQLRARVRRCRIQARSRCSRPGPAGCGRGEDHGNAAEAQCRHDAAS